MSFNPYNLRDDLAGARSVYRLSWGAYAAARGARTAALSGAVDLRKRNTPQDRPVGGHAKRAADIALAATALVLLAPLFLLIAALLYVGLGRRIFVAQQRIGFAGRRFTAYSFRTSPNNGVRNLTGEPALTTCLVSVLRDSGLDRLPQLASILRGDMSFVGPRPVEVGHPGPYCPDYFAARPGLFDIRQLDRSGHLGHRRLAAHDRYYVRRWSIWLDLAVLARSFAEFPPAENRTCIRVSGSLPQGDALDHAHGPVAQQDIHLEVCSAATGSCLPWIVVGKWPNQRVQGNGRH